MREAVAADEELQSEKIGTSRTECRAARPSANTYPADPRMLQAAKWLLPLAGHGLRQIVERYFQGHEPISLRLTVLAAQQRSDHDADRADASDLCGSRSAALPYAARLSKTDLGCSIKGKRTCRLPCRVSLDAA